MHPLKKKEILQFVATQMNLEDISKSERDQSQGQILNNLLSIRYLKDNSQKQKIQVIPRAGRKVSGECPFNGSGV